MVIVSPNWQLAGTPLSPSISTVFEDEGDCLPKITPGLFLGHSLTVGAGDFRTICYIPVVVFLNYGSEFIPHICFPQSILTFSSSSMGKILSRHPGHVEGLIDEP